MRLSFDSIEEVKAFVGELKGTRGGKKAGGEDGQAEGTVSGAGQQAPAPMMPPANFGGPAAGAAPGPQFNPQPAPGSAFPAGPAPGPDPAVMALAQRVSTRLDAAIASGQPVEQARAWVAGQIAAATNNAAASSYTLDQCKAALVNVPAPALESIAKLMNA